MFEKFLDVIKQVPVLNLLPIINDMASRAPAAWNNLSDEEKQKIVEKLFKQFAK